LVCRAEDFNDLPRRIRESFNGGGIEVVERAKREGGKLQGTGKMPHSGSLAAESFEEGLLNPFSLFLKFG